MNVKLRLLFNDRIGIVADISALIVRKEFNINTMEVVRKADKAAVYIDMENDKDSMTREEVLELLSKIPDLVEIGFFETLPMEERENRLQVVLDNISEGVISIDKEGKIAIINKVAGRIFNCGNRDVIGKDIRDLGMYDESVLECLMGKTFSNVKKDFINEQGRFQLFATGMPIHNSADRIIGAVEICKDMQEVRQLAKSISQPNHCTFSDIVGINPAMKIAISYAQKIAKTDSIVSIRGESGTGKELFAQAIHTASNRTGPFVPVNCAALPESILESELFGYVEGAFTGARRGGKSGLFESSKDGTVFLDEIAEMPLSSQTKIVRLIQEKSIRRIGGEKEIPVDTRIITATNRNLEKMVEEKTFREDLFYRINVLPFHIPPLRGKKEDIPILAEHFLFQLASQLNKSVKTITEAAMNKLIQHGWPGNVRELKNVIERAVIISDKDYISVNDIRFSHELGKDIIPTSAPEAVGGREIRSLSTTLNRYERQIISETMAGAESIRKAAKLLEVSHTTLLNKIKKHRIEVERKWTVGNISNQ